jgi:hypothetical protein
MRINIQMEEAHQAVQFSRSQSTSREQQAETTAEPVRMSGKHSTDRSLAEQGATSELGVRNTPREKGDHEAHDSISINREPARTAPGIK